MEGNEQAVDRLLLLLEEILPSYDTADDGSAIFAELTDPGSERGRKLDNLVSELGIEDCGENSESTAGLCAVVPEDVIVDLLGRLPPPEPRVQLGAQGCQWGEMSEDDAVAVQSGSAVAYSQALDFVREDGEPLVGPQSTYTSRRRNHG